VGYANIGAVVCHVQARAFAFKQLGEKPPPSGSSGSAKGGSGSCGGGGGGAGAGAAGGDDGGFYRGTDVVTLTDGNFDEEVIQSDDIWMVEVGNCCCYCYKVQDRA